MTSEMVDDLVERIEQRRLELQRARRDRIASLPQQTLEWMALVPVWTVELAEACADFPTGGESAQELLSRATELGMCRRETGTVGVAIDRGTVRFSPPSDAYWMPEQRRRNVLERAVDARGRDDVVENMGRIARSVRDTNISLPARLELWAEIAQLAPDLQAMIDALNAKVGALVDQQLLGEALSWMDIARLIEIPIGGGFAAATDRMARRIELEHRRRDDKLRLRSVYRRPAQAKAFTDLLEDDRAWALHYVGGSGVGKTTTLRYIADELAPRADRITARVDFDYLPAEYPRTEPWRLLGLMAEELRLYDETGAASAAFDQFDREEEALRIARLRRGAGVDDGAEDAATVLPSPKVGLGASAPVISPATRQALVARFAEAIGALDRKVVLLIDTCEELAKLRSDGALPNSVAETFEILEQLHDRVGSLRVVFCGRRSLASSGHAGAWSARDSEQPKRDYLRLHEIRGFTEEEASAFLAERNVPEELRPAILERLGERESSQRFDFRGAGPQFGVLRFNPFDLQLYAGWACDEKDAPDAATIRTASIDPYISIRILRRIDNENVAELVRLAAILGRFEADELRALSPMTRDAFDSAYRELLEQEWVEPAGSGFSAVQPRLRERLRSYFNRSGDVAWEQTTARAAQRLPAFVTELPVSQLAVAHLDALLRLVELDRALETWRALEQRLAEAEAWERLADLTMRLLATHGSAGPETLLHGAVRATHVSALMHTTPECDLEQEWAEVAHWLDRHGDAAGAEGLRLRTLAGICAAGRHPGARRMVPADELVSTLAAVDDPRWDEQVAASLVAAVEVAVEDAERGETIDQVSARRLVDELVSLDLSPGLAAFATTLQARLALLDGRREEAWEHFLSAVSACAVGPTAQRWLGWLAPDDIGSRVRLELLCATFPPERIRPVLGDVRPALTTAEGRWLEAALITLGLLLGPPSPEQVRELDQSASARSTDLPRVNAHLAYPPLFIARMSVCLGAGKVAAARRELELGRRGAESSLDGGSFADRWAGIGELTVIRRMRLRDERQDRLIGRQGADYAQQSLLWALDGLDGTKAPSVWARDQPTEQPMAGAVWADWRHARWRGIYARSEARARDAVAWCAAYLSHECHRPLDGSFAAMSCALDAVEAEQLAARVGLPRPSPTRSREEVVRAAVALEEAGESLGALRLLLRAEALWSVSADELGAVIERFADEVGYRRAALIAWDEGELAALRLPDAARVLLEHALTWSDRVGDPVGSIQAGCCLALTPCRDSPAASGLELRRILEASYRAVRSSEDELPAWEELERLSRADDGDPLTRLGPAEWRPWLVRLVVALARLDGRPVPPQLGTAVWQRHALRGATALATTEAGAGAAGERPRAALPSELEPWIKAPPRAVVEKPRTWLDRVQTAVVYVLPFGLGVAASVILNEVTSLSRWLPAVIGVLVVLMVWSLVKRELLRRSLLLVEVTPLNPGTSARAHATPIYRVRLTGAGPRVAFARLWSPVSGLVARADVIADRASVQIDPKPLEPVARTLRKVVSELGGRRRMPVLLAVHPDAAWVPWEGVLAGAASHDRDPLKLPLRFARIPFRAGMALPVSGGDVAVQAYVPGIAEADLVRVWKELMGSRAREVSILSLPWLLRPDETASVEITHVIGTFENQLGSVRLVVAAGDGPARWGEEHLRAAELPLRSSRTRLCVVQAQPVPRTRRTARERDQAALTRTFAAELADLGVPAVISLPPLTGPRARAALTALVAGVEQRRGDISSGHLAGIVERIRQAIAEPGDKGEPSFDVCLYDGFQLGLVAELIGRRSFEPTVGGRVILGGDSGTH